MFLVENDLYPKMLDPIDYREAKYSPELANELKKYVVLMDRHDLIDEINDSIKKLKKQSPKEIGASQNKLRYY